MKTDLINKLVMLFLVVGGLNLGIAQVSDTNVIERLLGTGSTVTGVVYVVMGVAALLGLYYLIDDTMHRNPTH